jgi:F-type H+-transporting ATPase subunit delta
MSDLNTAARPYARALFELASDEGNSQAWQEILQLASAVASDIDMQAIFESPSMLSKDQAELFLSVMAGVKDAPEQTPDFKNLVALLAENDRLVVLPAITSAFETLKQEAEGAIEVQVTSAQKLTAQQQAAMAKSLAKKLGKEVSITIEVDESLIAGAIIHAGDMVIDGSARGRLDKLATVLSK